MYISRDFVAKSIQVGFSKVPPTRRAPLTSYSAHNDLLLPPAWSDLTRGLPMIASESCSVMTSLVQNGSVPSEKSSNRRWITCSTEMSSCDTTTRLVSHTQQTSHPVEYKIRTSISSREITQSYSGLHKDLD